MSIGPSKDNTLYESVSGAISNGSGSYIFTGATRRGEARRALIAFDVASTIPAGATVQSVSLTLNVSQTTAGPEPVSLHAVSADWGEGSSAAFANEGGGAPAEAGDATWTHTVVGGAAWATPGGDFDATPSATLTVGSMIPHTWDSTERMVADVQRWLDVPGGNFGWVLIGNESSTRTAKRFDSRENFEESLRPVLTVTYLPAG